MCNSQIQPKKIWNVISDILLKDTLCFHCFVKKRRQQKNIEIWRKPKPFKNKENEGAVSKGIVKMPNVTCTTHLKDLIGADSHTLLKLLPGVSNFRDDHPKN